METGKSTDDADQRDAAPRHSQAALHGDDIRLSGEAQSLFLKALAVGLLGVGASALLAFQAGLRQFLHSYLVAFVWVLSIALGLLWWVTLQHLVGAKWSIVLRRVGELLAANMLVLAFLALPIVVPIFLGDGTLHIWADHERVHADHALHQKAPYLNSQFFAVRFLLYFGFWAWLGRYFLTSSLHQDQSNRPDTLPKAKRVSAPGMIAVALTLTFCAFDLLMSLNPYWFSTIFGVYYFAGCVISAHAVLILVLNWLQSKGRLKKSVTVEHYHDLGKMMFAFTIFWAYIGFSQFMLIWYANIPEETFWYKARFAGEWVNVSWVLVVCHFIIPFFGFLSRHVKRHRQALRFWAIWMLAVHWIDMYWLVMPNLSPEELPLHPLDLTSLLAVGGLFLASAAFQARGRNLVPVKDPRLGHSLAFENF